MASRKSAGTRKNNVTRKVAALPLFPIVGVGASAGGIQAFTELVAALPEKPGLALIFVVHTDRHESALADVISRETRIPVSFVSDGTPIAPDHIYVSHPDTEVAVSGGKLRVEKRKPGTSLPIDLLLGTLAEDQATRAVAVILSGSGSDGALGAKAVKAEGGITFAQGESAQFPNMPRAAVSSDAIDFVMSPAEIARELVRLAHHARMIGPGEGGFGDEELSDVHQLLELAHDVDFTHYNPSTIERRIRRRMALHRIDTLAQYTRLLRDHSAELGQLYADLLIRVTSFFRDPEVFGALQRDIIPSLMHERPPNEPLRVWVPGCATGEEVYSLAISFLELISERGWSCPLQIFGTDISDTAIEAARAGLYPENITADVSAERLGRFFTKTESGYRVAKPVRDCCVFARQNVTSDPPFSRLDLISCRNVMIYLASTLQRKVMAIFHYALRPHGYLLLGSSEMIGNFSDLFANSDRRHRIYQKKGGPAPVPVAFETATRRARAEAGRAAREVPAAASVFAEADRILLSRFSPPGVLVNDDMEILQFRGRTSAYLEPAPGAASLNLLKMAREGLLVELRMAIHAAKKTEAPVRRERVRVKNGGNTLEVNVEVLPFATTVQDRYFLVLFEDVPPAAEGTPKKRRGGSLERELESTREYLQSIIEEQEALNEELLSANEEMRSSNEELQSTNEELETAREELQASNEELTTLNEELENRAGEMDGINNDLINLLASVDIPIVMLDSSLRIRRFNPAARRALNINSSDAGRALGDLQISLMLDDVGTLVMQVIETLEMKELEVQDHNGRRHILRVRPYKTTTNRIEGAVLTLTDVDPLSRKNASA